MNQSMYIYVLHSVEDNHCLLAQSIFQL